MKEARPLFWIRFTSQTAAECLKDYFDKEIEIISEDDIPNNRPVQAILLDVVPTESDLNSINQRYPDSHVYIFSPTGPSESVPTCTKVSIPVSFNDLSHIFQTPLTALSHNLGGFILFPSSRRLENKQTKNTDLLTEKEVDILIYLLEHLQEDVSKEELLENVWGYKSDTTTHTLETHIYNLRQKLATSDGSSLLITTPKGYRLEIL